MMYADAIILVAFAMGFVEASMHSSYGSIYVPNKLRGEKRRQLSEYTCLDAVDLYLNESSILLYNNLAGFGPDGPDEDVPPVFQVANVGMYNDEYIDLVISVTQGDYPNMYWADIANQNRLKTDNKVGQINVNELLSPTFLFSFYVGGSYPNDPQPVVLPAFKFSIFDIDQSQKLGEEIVIKGWKYALFDHDTDELEISDTTCPPELNPMGENCLYAKSSDLGTGCDNPIDPLVLDSEFDCGDGIVDQFARSFQLEFENKSSFEVFFRSFHLPGKTSTGGRNFNFAFRSAWDELCAVRETPEPKDLLLDDLLCNE